MSSNIYFVTVLFNIIIQFFQFYKPDNYYQKEIYMKEDLYPKMPSKYVQVLKLTTFINPTSLLIIFIVVLIMQES